MIRKALFLSATVAAVALLAAPPADARSAEVRRAFACPSQTLGAVDVPADGATVSGYVVVKGYALDGNLVSNVDVYVDGKKVLGHVPFKAASQYFTLSPGKHTVKVTVAGKPKLVVFNATLPLAKDTAVTAAAMGVIKVAGKPLGAKFQVGLLTDYR